MITNSSDRTIRSFNLAFDPLVVNLDCKFLDSVVRNQWQSCCFTADGENVVGSVESNHLHNIYVWDKYSAAIKRILEGIKILHNIYVPSSYTLFYI